MKRILMSTVTLGLVAGAFGCVNLDEKLITGVSSEYYSTPDGLNSAVVASYAQLRGFYGREQLLSLTQVGTDTWMAADQAGSNNKDFDNYGGGFNSTDAPLANTWNPAYQAINTLNAALDRGPATQGISAAVKNSLLGEAHFLRALNYFTLVQQFGDVTLALHENKGVQQSAVRDPAANVYVAILADLDSAFNMLPVAQSDFGRATKGAAQALRAQVYLTRAYKDYSPSKQADFQSALTDAKAVINSGTYSLEPVFADLWCVARPADPGRSGYCENTGYQGNRKEFIFTIQFGPNGIYNATNVDADNEYNYLHLVFLGQYDNNGLWQGTPRDLNNGRPFRRLMPTPYELSLWNKYIGTPGASDILDTRFDGTFQSTWIATVGGVKNPVGTCASCSSNQAVNVGDTAAVYYTFGVPNSQRQSKAYETLTPCPTDQVAQPTAATYCGDRNNANDGFFNWQRFPSLKKYQDNLRANLTAQEGGKVQVVIRLGQMYLLAAEADVQLGNTAEAAQMINVLHVRAASPAHKSDYNVTAAQMNIDYVMEERERETAGEFTRWYDLVRVGSQYFVDRVKKFNPHAVSIALKNALRPIPQSQIDGVLVGPKYPQNPGY
ncbi:MAG TPA: RagB/SusD family nutrient uptake outer membrane protein [Gemmatimonadaceae bacterium]